MVISTACHCKTIGGSKTSSFSALNGPHSSLFGLKWPQWPLLISQTGKIWTGKVICLAQGNPNSQSPYKKCWLKLWEEVTFHRERIRRGKQKRVRKGVEGGEKKVTHGSTSPRPRFFSSCLMPPHFLVICLPWCLVIWTQRNRRELRARGIPGGLQAGGWPRWILFPSLIRPHPHFHPSPMDATWINIALVVNDYLLEERDPVLAIFTLRPRKSQPQGCCICCMGLDRLSRQRIFT